RFLSDCYQADNRHATLWDILGDKVLHPVVLTGRGEALTGLLPRTPLRDAERAAALQRDTYLYRKERTLVCGVPLVCGELLVGAQRMNVRAPLFLYAAELVDD